MPFDNTARLARRRKKRLQNIEENNLLQDISDEETEKVDFRAVLKRLNEARLKKIEQEEAERREAELIAYQRAAEAAKLQAEINKANLAAKKQAEKLLALEVSFLIF